MNSLKSDADEISSNTRSEFLAKSTNQKLFINDQNYNYNQNSNSISITTYSHEKVNKSTSLNNLNKIIKPNQFILPEKTSLQIKDNSNKDREYNDNLDESISIEFDFNNNNNINKIDSKNCFQLVKNLNF